MCPRYYDVKTCVPDTRQVCKDVIKTKCKTKDKVRSKSLSNITRASDMLSEEQHSFEHYKHQRYVIWFK